MLSKKRSAVERYGFRHPAHFATFIATQKKQLDELEEENKQNIEVLQRRKKVPYQTAVAVSRVANPFEGRVLTLLKPKATMKERIAQGQYQMFQVWESANRFVNPLGSKPSVFKPRELHFQTAKTILLATPQNWRKENSKRYADWLYTFYKWYWTHPSPPKLTVEYKYTGNKEAFDYMPVWGNYDYLLKKKDFIQDYKDVLNDQLIKNAWITFPTKDGFTVMVKGTRTPPKRKRTRTTSAVGKRSKKSSVPKKARRGRSV